MVRVNQPRRLARCWFAPLLLVAFFARKTGAQPASPAPGAEAKGAPLYRIAGQVVDARSALSRCAVEIVEVKKGIESHTMRTGEDGRFSFEGLPVAKYRLSASKPGFGTQSWGGDDKQVLEMDAGPAPRGVDGEVEGKAGRFAVIIVGDEALEECMRAEPITKQLGFTEADGIRLALILGEGVNQLQYDGDIGFGRAADLHALRAFAWSVTGITACEKEGRPCSRPRMACLTDCSR